MVKAGPDKNLKLFHYIKYRYFKVNIYNELNALS